MEKEQVLHISFNQDYGCFACGTSNGFRVYNSDPFKETFCRGFNNGGIGIVEMLFRCNILAIVGGGTAPKYPPNKVMIWDDHQGKCIGELSFRSQVRAVRLRRDRVVVALEHKVLVYNFADLKLVASIETLANGRGLVAMSPAPDSAVLACPGLHTGQVRIELWDRKQTRFISAHNSGLASLAVSLDGKRLATAGDKGTLVRVWSTSDGVLLQELRRGSDPAGIYSVAFSRGCEWLALSSAKGTVHVFALSAAVQTGGDGDDGSEPSGGGGGLGRSGEPGVASGGSSPNAVPGPRQNPTSVFSVVKGYVPFAPLPKYFASEWSFAQYRLAPEEAATSGRTIIGFPPGSPNTLVLVTQGGGYHRITFDPSKGGQCSQSAYGNYIREPDDAVVGL